MMSSVLSKYHLPGLACLGLLIFFGVFVGAVAWIHRRGGAEFYRSLGKMPLDDGEGPVNGGTVS
jgi:cbb3-type cytochrome oxidase subunit 3